MTARLPTGPRAEPEVGGLTRSARRRRYALAYGRALYGLGAQVARGLGIAARTVTSWCEPQGRDRSPAETLALSVHLALAGGADRAEALAPVREVAQELGCQLVASPGALPYGYPVTRIAVERELGDALAHVGGTVQAIALAIGDGRVTEAEVDGVRAQIHAAHEELLEVAAMLERLAEGAAHG